MSSSINAQKYRKGRVETILGRTHVEKYLAEVGVSAREVEEVIQLLCGSAF